MVAPQDHEQVAIVLEGARTAEHASHLAVGGLDACEVALLQLPRVGVVDAPAIGVRAVVAEQLAAAVGRPGGRALGGERAVDDALRAPGHAVPVAGPRREGQVRLEEAHGQEEGLVRGGERRQPRAGLVRQQRVRVAGRVGAALGRGRLAALARRAALVGEERRPGVPPRARVEPGLVPRARHLELALGALDLLGPDATVGAVGDLAEADRVPAGGAQQARPGGGLVAGACELEAGVVVQLGASREAPGEHRAPGGAAGRHHRHVVAEEQPLRREGVHVRGARAPAQDRELRPQVVHRDEEHVGGALLEGRVRGAGGEGEQPQQEEGVRSHRGRARASPAACSSARPDRRSPPPSAAPSRSRRGRRAAWRA